MSQHYALTQGRHGQFLYNTHDTFIGRSLALYGEWSEGEVTLFDQVVRAGDIVIEAGSNIGTHTVWLSKKVGEQGRVISFEANRYTFQLLSANLALNECFNVLAHHQAIGDEAKPVMFPLLDPRADNNFGSLSLADTRDMPREQVSQSTVDALNLDKLDFIKVDIEGHELHFLKGAAQTIQKCRPVIYVEFNDAKNDMIAYFNAIDYSVYYYVSPMYNPDNFKKNLEDSLNGWSTDFICVPNEKARVTGLSQATIDDGLFGFYEGGVWSAAADWRGAQFNYL